LIPLVSVRLDGAGAAIWCKLEYLNPSGSTKDRIAEFILRRALVEQRLVPGQTVVEASSGSTSIAMARTSSELGLRFTAVVPAGVSNERVLIDSGVWRTGLLYSGRRGHCAGDSKGGRTGSGIGGFSATAVFE